MIKEESTQSPDVFLEVDKGEYLKINMSLPLQILFDDVMTFVSKTDFDF